MKTLSIICTGYILGFLLGFFAVLLLDGCAYTDKAINKATKVADGFVKVHDIVQTSSDDIQQFCADMYLELENRPRAQKRLVDFCNGADRALDEIQRIEKKFLLDEIKDQ